jgi:hypothetical protein
MSRGPGRRGSDDRHRKLRCVLLAGTAAAVGLLSASPAAASTIEGTNFLRVTAGSGEENHITVNESGNSFVIADTAGIADNSSDCNQDTPNQITCTRNATAISSATFLDVKLGDLSDELAVNMPTPEDEHFVAAGGAGNDRIDLSGMAARSVGRTATVVGDAGDDTMIGSQGANFYDEYSPSDPSDYDAGNDTMIGGPLLDWMHGGRGSDFLDGRGAPDLLEGRTFEPVDSTDPFPDQFRFVDDQASDTIFCGGNQPAPPGNAYDTVWAGVGERIGIDCEQIQQDVLCPEGALCDGTPLISTLTTTASAGSAAVAARRKRRKVVLGRAPEKIRLKGGKRGSALITLRKRRVRRALGARRRMTVTFSQNFDRIRNGRKIGESNRRKRFRMRRR